MVLNVANTVRRARSFGPPVLVQNSGRQSGNNVSTLSYTFTTLPTVGNYLILAISGWQTSGFSMASVTDNKGNTYTRVVESSTVVFCSTSIWIAKVISSSSTFTITITSTQGANNFIECSISEWSLLTSSAVTDKTASNGQASATSDATVGPTTALADFHELSIAATTVSQASTNVNFSIPAGWAELSKNNDSFATIGHHAIYKRTTGTGALTVNWTHDNTSQDGWTAAIATFRLLRP